MFPQSVLNRDRHAAGVVAIALLVASYLLFSLRTAINPVEPGEFLSFKRLCATAVGATMFWFVSMRLHKLIARGEQARLWQWGLLILSALGAVLATRVGYDLITGTTTEAMWARNLRWVIAWSGYFLAALLAYRIMLLRDSAPISRSTGAVDYETARFERLIDEVSNLDQAQRIEVIRALKPAVYEEADPIAYLIER